ncbi:hypothetical protein 101114BS4_019 [Escherichia phage vB_EcoS-101114BS4]|uniref:Uncharacterized protein n=1 Tax=Escherichia phage vB_EcoS-101114BS4 TaxID=2865793 RepID=A0AAE7XSE1_9CAUD|nr:hypothetical protein P9606_gp19 [Escherichia phage vB_EcoS-101114BS4]QZI79079.1 hypothetical protein 101114BS4_019 [Escherichia phage vB_EcoS-101114BS4]
MSFVSLICVSSLLVCNQYSATNTCIASEFCDYFYR